MLADFIINNASEEEIAKQYGEKYRRSLLGEGYEVEDFFPSLGEDGKWLFFTASPLRNEAGEVIGALICFRLFSIDFNISFWPEVELLPRSLLKNGKTSCSIFCWNT